jgi:hypothetical protein
MQGRPDKKPPRDESGGGGLKRLFDVRPDGETPARRERSKNAGDDGPDKGKGRAYRRDIQT